MVRRKDGSRHTKEIRWLTRGKFNLRMRRLLVLVKESGYGHNGVGTEHTVGSISEWVDAKPSQVRHASDTPSHALYSILSRDPGYIAAVYVATGETRFYLCTDCRFPMLAEDRKGGCPVCGDCWSNERPVEVA